MNSRIKSLVAILIFVYVVVFYLGIFIPVFRSLPVVVTLNGMVIVTVLFVYFSKKSIGWKDNFLLITIITYLTIGSLAKFGVKGQTSLILVTFLSTLLLVVLELYDWFKKDAKREKMSLIQFICLLFFFALLITKIQFYTAAYIILSLAFDISLILVGVELLLKKRVHFRRLIS